MNMDYFTINNKVYKVLSVDESRNDVQCLNGNSIVCHLNLAFVLKNAKTQER